MTVPQMFDTISSRYDLINKILSLGLDRYWRRVVCKHLPSQQRIKLLDCATGTGDQLVSILKNCPHVYDSVGMDPADEMLAIGSKKLLPYSSRAKLISASAEAIPFPNEMFDAITISFGIRNVADLSKSLSEIYRTLSPQGRLIILEFSHPQQKALRSLHRFYLNRVVSWVGKKLSSNEDAYTYLSNTIETFPQGDALKNILKQTGFLDVRVKPLTFGVVSLYICGKR